VTICCRHRNFVRVGQIHPHQHGRLRSEPAAQSL